MERIVGLDALGYEPSGRYGPSAIASYAPPDGSFATLSVRDSFGELHVRKLGAKAEQLPLSFDEAAAIADAFGRSAASKGGYEEIGQRVWEWSRDTRSRDGSLRVTVDSVSRTVSGTATPRRLSADIPMAAVVAAGPLIRDLAGA